LKKAIYTALLCSLIYVPTYGQINWFNRPPTIDEIPDYGPVAENSGPHSIILTGISPGTGERNQEVTITANSDNTDLISNLTVDYKQGDDQAELTFRLVKNEIGKSRITVTLNDGNYFRGTTRERFDVSVVAVNDPPTFVLKSDLVVVEENAGQIEINAFASEIDDGDPDEDQKLEFVTILESVTNNLKFKSKPKVDKSGNLKFEARRNRYGEAQLSLQLIDDGGTKNGGNDTSDPGSFTIRVNKINQPPTIDEIPDYGPVVEDSGPHGLTLTGISPGTGEGDQKVIISAVSDNAKLISNLVVDYKQGNEAELTFDLVNDASGKSTITVTLDDGESSKGITTETFDVVVVAVNDPPTFVLKSNLIVVEENDGQIEINAFATEIDDGDPDEDQKLEFVTVLKKVTNNLKFKSQPQTDERGNLTFEAINNTYGEAQLSLQLIDDEGTENGGNDRSDPVSFTIRVNKINKPPTIDDIPDYGPIAKNSGPHNITLRGISPGQGEGNQELTITAISDNTDLISNLVVDYKQGDQAELTFDLVKNANGKSTVTVTLKDGESFRGVTTETFDVTVLSVNQPPSFVLNSDKITVKENAGLIEINAFATNIDDGDPDRNQKLEFITILERVTNNLKFKSEPQVDEKGNLTFEIQKNRHGEAQLSLQLIDDGGTKYGGDNTSDPVPFTIRVSKTNNPPTINPIKSPITIVEDHGDQTLLLTGISAGLNETQQLQISVEVDDQNLITTPVVEYVGGSDQADLSFSTRPNQFGEAQITLLLDDGQSENNTTSLVIVVVIEPVADTPSVTDAATDAGMQTKSGLVVSRNAQDGKEVTHYKISNIFNGLLYQNDGITPIVDEEFITHEQGNAGLKYTPLTSVSSNGGFSIQAALGPEEELLGGEIITASVAISSKPPEFTSTPISTVTATKQFLYNITTTDEDKNDVLKFSFVVPEEIQSWISTKDFGDGTAQLAGIPPEGSAGQYLIVVIVEDQFGNKVEQEIDLLVKEANKPPTLSTFTIRIDEDDSIFLNRDTFKSSFSDPDGDSIQLFQLVSAPIYGTVIFHGRALEIGDTVEMNDQKAFFYVPERNYSGLDVFDWNLSDGADFAEFPKRANIVISPVFDPPEIKNLESSAIVFEYGDEQFKLTETGLIIDEDSETLERAVFSFSSGYTIGEDSLSYEQIEDLEFTWDEQNGVLNVEGKAPISDYQQLLSSMWYCNKKSLSPNTDTRQVGIVLYDSDTLSRVYYRQVEFGSSFDDLNLIIPTGFTPNGDGINDVWYVENLSRYPEYRIEVYSRAGKRLFEAINRASGWNGKYNGSLVPAGTYYYFINLSNYDRVFKGSVTVLW